MVFRDQSADWENRALSLERDFTDAVGRAAPGYLAPFRWMTLGRSVSRPGGCTGKWFERKLRIGDVSKLNPRDFTLYRTKPANTFRQGPVAGNCNLQGDGAQCLSASPRIGRGLGPCVDARAVFRRLLWYFFRIVTLLRSPAAIGRRTRIPFQCGGMQYRTGTPYGVVHL